MTDTRPPSRISGSRDDLFASADSLERKLAKRRRHTIIIGLLAVLVTAVDLVMILIARR